VARATLVLGVAHGVQLVTSLANLELLTRALGPSLYGDYSAIVATYVVLGALTDLGTGLVAVREMSREPSRARATLVAATRLRLLAGIVASALGAARFAHDAAGLVGAALPLVQAWSSSRLLLQALLEKTKLARATVLGRLLQTGLVFAATRLRPDPLGAVAALALGELAVAALLRVEAGSLPHVPWSESLREGRTIALAALPLAGAFIANEVAGSLDVLLLKALRTSEETGLYALASRPLQLLEPMPRLLLWSIFPILSRRAAEGDAEGVARAHRTTLAALSLAAAPLAALAALTGPELLGFLFDPRYEAAGRPLVLLAFGGALGFLAAPAESALVALGHTRRNLVASLGALAVNVAANVVLIPRWGMLGAAWAWVGTSATQVVLANALVGIRPPLLALARSALIALAVYFALRPLRGALDPLALAGLGAAVYALMAVLLGATRVLRPAS